MTTVRRRWTETPVSSVPHLQPVVSTKSIILPPAAHTHVSPEAAADGSSAVIFFPPSPHQPWVERWSRDREAVAARHRCPCRRRQAAGRVPASCDRTLLCCTWTLGHPNPKSPASLRIAWTRRAQGRGRQGPPAETRASQLKFHFTKAHGELLWCSSLFYYSYYLSEYGCLSGLWLHGDIIYHSETNEKVREKNVRANLIRAQICENSHVEFLSVKITHHYMSNVFLDRKPALQTGLQNVGN